MKLYGLIGYPLGHSFSASFFAEKFSREGLNAQYRNFPLQDISEFRSLIQEESSLKGLNVTVPYKQEVIPYLQELSRTSSEIGAVNTISFSGSGNSLYLKGDNTDVIGFRRSLEEQLRGPADSALVLGTGGSSKAICFVLEQMGIPYTRVSRSGGEDRISYKKLDAERVAAARVIINTTPLGMHPHVQSSPEIPYELLTSGHLLFDLVYNPPLTRFLELGRQRGAKIVNGYDMLVYQAEASWLIWNS